MSRPVLVPILGDQLTPTLSSLSGLVPGEAVIVMAEVMAEAIYVRHHKAKIALVFSAMRHFAEEMRARGWTVDYITLNAPDNPGSLAEAVTQAARRRDARMIRVTEPGEWRLKVDIDDWSRRIGLPVEIVEDRRFIASHADFADFARGRKQWRMEHFYRRMRAKTGLLMEGDAPAGGQWNFDADNRKRLPDDLILPDVPAFPQDATTRAVIDLVNARFPDHFGSLDAFNWPVTAEEAGRALDDFIECRLPRFGDYQDAMRAGAPHLHHSLLSTSINLGLLDPLQVCRRAEAEWRAGRVPLNAAEGFIRQILGWREYVRGIYWALMPDYATRNALGHDRALPSFYWTGNTGMACMADAIGQTRRLAYAHHIQRLMVTGNFALLAGVDPAEVHEWYLAVYADAYEWVELPNTIGMSQHADGGVMASKPYAASGAYINRMSDHCRSCAFDVDKRTEPEACPFNALYWGFVARHADRFAGNPRMAQIVRSWRGFDADRQSALLARAGAILAALDAGKAISPGDFNAVMAEEAPGPVGPGRVDDGEEPQGRLFR